MEIKLIKDGAQYYLTVGEVDAWLDTLSAMRLDTILHEALVDDLVIGIWPNSAIVRILRYVADEYGGKTIDNIIKQMEARIKEYEDKASKQNPQGL